MGLPKTGMRLPETGRRRLKTGMGQPKTDVGLHSTMELPKTKVVLIVVKQNLKK